MEKIMLSPITIDELATVIQMTVKREFETINNSQKPEPDNDYLSRKETCKILGISLPTLNDYTKRGLVPSYRIGARIRYKKEEVLKSLSYRQFTKKVGRAA
ncbi:MAG: helix-turn-helix domain-containing protein [Bacteroidetes bacterium]|nr:helix-turn-helix domain-containing protein [Bacteroidota bacterium]